MLQPKRTKYRKAFKGRIHGLAKGGAELNFGAFGLKAVEPARITMSGVDSASDVERAERLIAEHGDPFVDWRA